LGAEAAASSADAPGAGSDYANALAAVESTSAPAARVLSMLTPGYLRELLEACLLRLETSSPGSQGGLSVARELVAVTAPVSERQQVDLEPESEVIALDRAQA